MRRYGWIGLVLLGLLGGLWGASWRLGLVRAPWHARYAELAAQLRDRGPVAVLGRAPLGLLAGDTPLVPVGRYPAVSRALAGGDSAAVARALRAGRVDGLLVTAGAPAGPSGAVSSALVALRPTGGLSAVYLDAEAALYEPAERVTVSPEDARRLVSVVRLVLGGATAPPERLFPEAIRRSRSAEVALVVRDGHEAILWRSNRAGSVARALLDVTFAVLDAWTSRQQARHGSLRDALRSRTLTLAIFYDKGVLGARDAAFLRRAADPRVWGVGFERLTSWEYVLPPAPWAPAPEPSEALGRLARDRGVPSPGIQRPQLTLYRYRALQMVEESAGGPVTLWDHS
ncbi:MAG: hypothetical protein HY909_21390 [Deltaproteobacteria bacterium]|nr:hypothetical protein [Deltaproteobacteria bacterium]